ncbi:MAG: hypothetical protein R3B13_36350 [Polyangiaceae bacterium]
MSVALVADAGGTEGGVGRGDAGRGGVDAAVATPRVLDAGGRTLEGDVPCTGTAGRFGAGAGRTLGAGGGRTLGVGGGLPPECGLGEEGRGGATEGRRGGGGGMGRFDDVSGGKPSPEGMRGARGNVSSGASSGRSRSTSVSESERLPSSCCMPARMVADAGEILNFRLARVVLAARD